MTLSSAAGRAMRCAGMAVGFAIAVVALGWTLGGQAALGRIDPALAIPVILFPALCLMRFGSDQNGRNKVSLAGLCLLGLMAGQAGLGIALAGRALLDQLGITAIATILALLISDRFWHYRLARTGRRSVSVLGACMLLVAWFAGSHLILSALYTVRAQEAQMPGVTVMSSLPLRGGGASDMASAVQHGMASAPALAWIERRFATRLVDALHGAALRPGTVLLLIHPRALPPAELVAIDGFVRAGGRAIIMADALSSWPVDYPLGDVRNPPVTSLLTPLLDHWGVSLGGVDMADQRSEPVYVGSRRVALFSAGVFDRLPPGCHSYGGKRIADCPIGAGRVWLIGDADLLYAPLWQAPVAGAAHLRRADTMPWLESLILNRAAPPESVLSPQWIRADCEDSGPCARPSPL